MGVDLSKGLDDFPDMSDPTRNMSASKPVKPKPTKAGASDSTPEQPLTLRKHRLSLQKSDAEHAAKKRAMPLSEASAGSPATPASESTTAITAQKISTPTEPAGPYTGPPRVMNARFYQQSTNLNQFRDWKPSDGDGPEEGWEQSPILFNPAVPPTDVEEFPRRRFLSDAAVLALVNVCEKGQRGKLAPADFNIHGEILRERICRGFPAMTEDGRIIRYGGRDLRGGIQLQNYLIPDFLDLQKGDDIPEQLFGPDLDFYQQNLKTRAPSRDEFNKELNFQKSLQERQLRASQKLLSGQSGSNAGTGREASPDLDNEASPDLDNEASPDLDNEASSNAAQEGSSDIGEMEKALNQIVKKITETSKKNESDLNWYRDETDRLQKENVDLNTELASMQSAHQALNKELASMKALLREISDS